MLDSLIIGAGPAGLTALLYQQLYGLKSVCIGDVIGGKLMLAPKITDFPGIVSISGKKYIAALLTQLQKLNAQIKVDSVISVRKQYSADNLSYFLGKTRDETFESQTVIFATGNSNKQKERSEQKIAESLGIELNHGFFLVDKLGRTNDPRVYAAGDCLLYPASLEQLTTSVASGIKAAAGVCELLKKSKPPIIWGGSQNSAFYSGRKNFRKFRLNTFFE